MMKKIKDKRIDNMLNSRGIKGATIFYSPISFWVLTIVVIIISGISILYAMIMSKLLILIAPYLILSYLLNAYLNNSFAVTKEKVIVINPNFPFRQFISYHKNEIELITIDKIRTPWWNLLLITGRNKVIIKTNTNRLLTYHCINLEEEGYEETWTKETLDSLNRTLQELGYKTIFHIEN